MLIRRMRRYRPSVEPLWTKTKRSKNNTKKKFKNGKSLHWLFLVIHSWIMIKNSSLMKTFLLQRTHCLNFLKRPHKWLGKSVFTHLQIFLKNSKMTLSIKNFYNSLANLIHNETTKSLPDLKVCLKRRRLKPWKSSKLKQGKGWHKNELNSKLNI